MGAGIIGAFIDGNFFTLFPCKECIMTIRAEEPGFVVFAVFLV